MITPVLLAGGAGTRLWPLSRKSYPKQFSPILGNSSLFQKALARFTTGKHVSFRPPVILTNSGSRFIVTEQLEQAGIDPGAILIEPSRRNTGPAILAAALYLMENDPDTVMLVAPSDHLIPDRNSFHRAIQSGLHAVKNGRIVTFGIIPTRADTGFGYLEIDACPNGDGPL
ncbi:MAG TPA: mannose-1-phosphate guanylyltransferase/mannose-6-phosphate isomerase, partial [Rhodobacteraceae bacterium]|nr:mannose-1-phosphate guanylyltransferase/mannose-6-phosphate isomerase [Paracoccaceae bacterium]